MDPKNLSQLDPKLREAYERIMGTGSAPASSDQPPTDPKPADPPPAAPPPASPPPPVSSPDPISESQQPNPIEPIPTITPANSQSSAELASPSVFGVDIPPPPPPTTPDHAPVQQAPMDDSASEPMDVPPSQNPSLEQAPVAPVEVPPPPPPPPTVAQNDPSHHASEDSATHVNRAISNNKLMPVLIAIALIVLLVVWAFFWVQLLL